VCRPWISAGVPAPALHSVRIRPKIRPKPSAVFALAVTAQLLVHDLPGVLRQDVFHVRELPLHVLWFDHQPIDGDQRADHREQGEQAVERDAAATIDRLSRVAPARPRDGLRPFGGSAARVLSCHDHARRRAKRPLRLQRPEGAPDMPTPISWVRLACARSDRGLAGPSPSCESRRRGSAARPPPWRPRSPLRRPSAAGSRHP
jgi:hypothetical protein